MKRAVLKFGGSSVETLEKMQKVADRIIARRNNQEQLVIVVSAMGKTTNELLSLARKAAMNPSKREVDQLISTGEQVSISLLTMILNERNCPAVSLTGFQAGIKTHGFHTKNKIVDIDVAKIVKYLNENKVVVVAGFQGINSDGDITTLGRGGSDTTAVALAAKLNSICEIYTDVEGIYGVDPKIYKDAKKLDVIGYEEMKEMSFLGAKVMEPRSIEIAHRFNVPIYVASTHQYIPGTYIKKVEMEPKNITGLTMSEKVMMVTMNKLPYKLDIIADIFIRLANNEINVELIRQTINKDYLLSVAFIASADDIYDINTVISEIIKIYPQIEVIKDLDIVKVSVIGHSQKNQTLLASEIFKLLTENGIRTILVIISKISISYIIESSNKLKAVNVIAENYNL